MLIGWISYTDKHGQQKIWILLRSGAETSSVGEIDDIAFGGDSEIYYLIKMINLCIVQTNIKS